MVKLINKKNRRKAKNLTWLNQPPLSKYDYRKAMKLLILGNDSESTAAEKYLNNFT